MILVAKQSLVSIYMYHGNNHDHRPVSVLVQSTGALRYTVLYFYFYLFICVKRKSAHRERKKKKKNKRSHTHTKKKGLQSCINNFKAPEKNSKLLPNHLH